EVSHFWYHAGRAACADAARARGACKGRAGDVHRPVFLATQGCAAPHRRTEGRPLHLNVANTGSSGRTIGQRIKEAAMTCSSQAMDTRSDAVRTFTNAPRLGDFVRQAWHAYWARKARRATVYMLRSLDDHALHDIGVHRSEIESVVYGRSGER